ncbi:hypothetical protein EV361DRAFT_674598 [Lentinula raphanica]|nr:hypothetical protein EV361DRAFT_674598 [Lentinula raphanica]
MKMIIAFRLRVFEQLKERHPKAILWTSRRRVTNRRFHGSKDLQLGPGVPNLWPPVGKKPVSVPPVAFPPGFPSIGRLVVYTRIARIPEPSLKGKVESLQQSSIWESIDPKIRDAQLRSQAYVRGDPRRKKLLNAYLILANNKNKVVEQINWLQETLFYLHYQVYYSEIIKRVLKDSDLELEPDDMIKLGLADPSEASFGASYLSGAYRRVEAPDSARLLRGTPWQ